MCLESSGKLDAWKLACPVWGWGRGETPRPTPLDQPPEWRLSPTWRELVLAACREQGIDELLDPQSNDLDEWEVLIYSLAGGVLWDEDWRDGESLLDADPKAGGAVKKFLGIDEDYYVAVPPDPSDEEMAGVLATLRGLTQGVS